MRNPYAAYKKQTVEKKELPVGVSNETRIENPNPTRPIARAQKNYQESEIMTATPEKLTLLLYEGALKFMEQGRVHLTEKKLEEANNTLLRAQDIIQELMITLNMDYGVSSGLYAMYDYILHCLTQANVEKNHTHLEGAIAFTKDLRDTWLQVMQQTKETSAPKTTAWQG